MNFDENCISSILEEASSRMPKHRKKNLYLSDYQIEVLESFGIDFNKYNDLKSIIFQVESILNEENDDELEKISSELSEFYYYNNTNK